MADTCNPLRPSILSFIVADPFVARIRVQSSSLSTRLRAQRARSRPIA